MPIYTFRQEEDISDHIPDDEEVANIAYFGVMEWVKTEKVESSDNYKEECEVESCDEGPFETQQGYAGHMTTHK
jgi:hypothetical protein